MPSVPGFNPDLGLPAGDHRDDARPRRGHRLRERQPGAPDAALSRSAHHHRQPDSSRHDPGRGVRPPGQLDRLDAATAAHYKLGIQTLRELSKSGKPFFLGVDPFLPEDAFEAPRVYVEPSKIEKLGLGPMDGRLTPLHFSRATT